MEAMNQRQKFGPFAVHQVFPLNAESIMIYDLSLRSRNRGSVGLDRIGEIRAQDEELEDINLVQWRALVPINNLKNDGDFTPRLSRQGALLVHGHAASKGKQLGTRFVIIVQGLTRRYIWDNASTPPSITIYSHGGGQYTFRAISLAARTFRQSLADRRLLSHSVIAWLRENKSLNQRTDMNSIVDRYRQEFPHQRRYEERDNKRNVQTHRSHVRTGLIPVLSLMNGRRMIKEERLIDKRDYKNILYDMKTMQDMGLIGQVQGPSFNAQPKPAPDTTTPHLADATGVKPSRDEILESTPLYLFDTPELPSAGGKWVCPFDKCHSEWSTTLSVYPGTAKYDRETIKFRQKISRHLLEHLSRDPVALNLFVSLHQSEEEEALNFV